MGWRSAKSWNRYITELATNRRARKAQASPALARSLPQLKGGMGGLAWRPVAFAPPPGRDEGAHKKARALGLLPIVLAIGVAIWLKWPGLMPAGRLSVSESRSSADRKS